MTLVARIGSVVVIGLLAVLLVGGYANAGDKKTAKYNDERSTGGKFYPPSDYAPCDVDKLTVTSKRGKLIVKATFRGKHDKGRTVIDQLYVNTKGGGSSKPEFKSSGNDGASVYEYKSYDDTGSKVKSKTTKKGKGQSVELPLKTFGRGVDKLGVQIQTCGEGAVDIAPGKDYFDDENYDGTIKFKSLNVKV